MGTTDCRQQQLPALHHSSLPLSTQPPSFFLVGGRKVENHSSLKPIGEWGQGREQGRGRFCVVGVRSEWLPGKVVKKDRAKSSALVVYLAGQHGRGGRERGSGGGWGAAAAAAPTAPRSPGAAGEEVIGRPPPSPPPPSPPGDFGRAAAD